MSLTSTSTTIISSSLSSVKANFLNPSVELLEVTGWLAVNEEEKRIEIWEGVLALWSSSELSLFKLCQGKLVRVFLDKLAGYKIFSSGYWTCAELRGELESGHEFLYHAISSGEAMSLITKVETVMKSRLLCLEIRLDPDPLREEDSDWIDHRMNSWLSLRESLNLLKFSLVRDPEMPL